MKGIKDVMAYTNPFVWLIGIPIGVGIVLGVAVNNVARDTAKVVRSILNLDTDMVLDHNAYVPYTLGVTTSYNKDNDLLETMKRGKSKKKKVIKKKKKK